MYIAYYVSSVTRTNTWDKSASKEERVIVLTVWGVLVHDYPDPKLCQLHFTVGQNCWCHSWEEQREEHASDPSPPLKTFPRWPEPSHPLSLVLLEPHWGPPGGVGGYSNPDNSNNASTFHMAPHNTQYPTAPNSKRSDSFWLLVRGIRSMVREPQAETSW